METRKHRWGLYFAIEDFGKPRPKRTIHDGIDISLLKDIRPGNYLINNSNNTYLYYFAITIINNRRF
ncbi:hypothetical protein EB796_006162 [Bugula neritina]|uniref:Uncharacterized protein n=1 Tax=Bugula neritina TaxID=10212 RepID=A0A7J7KA45_BUGNE|nr:hypothetical protein EB796_006162 [Bugula neritina]